MARSVCGIAGTISISAKPGGGVDPAGLLAMGDAIAHRGPDGDAYLLYGPQSGIRVFHASAPPADAADATVGFAHRRLAIIDLSDANEQPMVDTGGEYALCFNGEIYNYLELRRELEGLGHKFQTTGDTEVLLEAYKAWGSACVERFVGMWAFALLDALTGTVLLSRDRFGIKPLYYARRGEAIHFASEIKALLTMPGVLGEPNLTAVGRFMVGAETDVDSATFFEGIEQLPPAHNLVVPLADTGARSAPRPYWQLPAEAGYRGSQTEAAREFADLFTDSVTLHARSDVGVGTCLSGGIDSSAIVCFAAQLRERGEIPNFPHRAFGYIPEDPAWSERRYMEEIVARTAVDLTYVEVPTPSFVDQLIDIIRIQDEPFVSTSQAAQYFVFQSAGRAGVKVMLDGQGADETLGGYHGNLGIVAASLLHRRRLLAYARFAHSHKALYGAPPYPRAAARQMALAPLMALPGRLRGSTQAPPPELPIGASVLSERARAAAPLPDNRLPGSINELLRHQTGTQNLPQLLRYEDRNSMAHSIEARVPFLDHRLVELEFNLPGDYKIHGAETKHVLREAIAGVVPEEIRTRRDKIGFRGEPAVTWEFAARHRESLLEQRTAYESELLEAGAVSRLIDGAERGTEHEYLLWRTINLKLWLRAHWGEGEALV